MDKMLNTVVVVVLVIGILAAFVEIFTDPVCNSHNLTNDERVALCR